MAIINKEPETTKDGVAANRAAIEHRATWMGLIYDQAVRSGVGNAEEIVREAIGRTGSIHGVKYRDMMKDPQNCEEFSHVFLPELVRETFDQEVVANEDELNVSFHYCPLVSAWRKLGIEDDRIATLCDLAMEGDRKIAEENDLSFDLKSTIANGDSACELCLSKRN